MVDRGAVPPGLAWLAGGLLAALVLALHVAAALALPAFQRGEFIDPDGYTRMLRVLQLWHGEAWYAPPLRQINAPDGLPLHWTRPLDVLILLPAWPAVLLGMPAERALYWSGSLICPVLHLLACLAAVWAARPLWPASWCWLAGVIMALNPASLGYSTFGRADHHTAILLASVVGLGFALRAAAGQRRAAPWAGAAFGLGFWISPETLLVAMPALAAFGLLWLWNMPGASQSGARMALAMAAVLAVAVAVERPPAEWLLAQGERVSVQHVGLALAIAAVFATLEWIPTRLGFAPRGVAGGAIGAAGAAALLLVWPGLFGGARSPADGDLGAAFLKGVLEMQPLGFGSRAMVMEALARLSPGICGLLALGLAARRGPRLLPQGWRAAAPVVLLTLLGTMAATVSARRFGADLAVPGAIAAAGLMPLAAIAADRGGALLRLPAMILAFGAVVALPVVATGGGGGGGEDVASEGCDGAAIGRELGRLHAPARGGAARGLPVLLADSVNVGPPIAWFAGVRVVAAPHHQAAAMFADTNDAFASEAGAQAVVTRRNVAFLLVCRHAVPIGTTWPPDGFRARLLAGEAPGWLAPVPLPGGLAETFRLYEVRLTR